jgi:protein TonB
MIEGRRSTGRILGEWLLWTTAGLFVVTAHAGAVAYLLREPVVAMEDSGPPPAIMIELAPAPEAVVTEETDISTDQVDAEEVKTATSEPPPEPVEPPPVQPLPEPIPEPEPEVTEEVVEPPPVVEPEPLPEPVEEIDPVEELVMAQLENVEVPIPMVRPPKPKPEIKKPVEPKKKVVKKQQAPAPTSEAARKAKAEVAQSTRNAGQQAASGSGQRVSPQKWLSRVHAHILRRKKSILVNSDALVTIRFTFDGSGNILSVSARNSTGDAALNEAAISMVRRSSPIPAPPSGQTFLDVPIRFQAR